MLHLSETVVPQDVQIRLAARFPQVPVEVVEAAIRIARTDHPGPTGDHLPVEVERQAGARLMAITDGPVTG